MEEDQRPTRIVVMLRDGLRVEMDAVWTGWHWHGGRLVLDGGPDPKPQFPERHVMGVFLAKIPMPPLGTP